MSLTFNADEVFRMAEQIEKNGSHFYRRAAEVAANSRAAQLFLRLAAMEEEHEKIFARMRAELGPKDRQAAVPDPEGEAAAYLQAWADGNVFDLKVDPAQRIQGREKVEEILQMALGLEKDSIVFYLGMKEAVPESMGHAKIEGIIKEEMGHIATLSRELATLSHQIM